MTDQTLLQQITDFCRLLRQMGVNVTTTNQLSWCESVQLIDIGEREAFYHTARTNLIAEKPNGRRLTPPLTCFGDTHAGIPNCRYGGRNTGTNQSPRSLRRRR